jgi:hypothetical protein
VKSSHNREINKVKSALEGPNRQAPGSTSRTLDEPTPDAFAEEVKKLQKLAKPCEEVTISIHAHGNYGKYPKNSHSEHGVVNYSSVADSTGENSSILATAAIGPSEETVNGRDLNELIKGFSPGVSVTVFVAACWGGAFAAEGNVELSDLVHVIGASTMIGIDAPCRNDLDDALVSAIENFANNTPDGRATAGEVTWHMAQGGWSMGPPSGD